MEKQLFLHTPTVQVNSEYALFNHQWRFEIKKINGVSVTRLATYKRYPITFGVIFVLIAITSSSVECACIGIFLFIIACLMRPQYVLRIKTGTGEVRPLVSKKRTELEDIKQAIEKAIMHDSYYDYKPIEAE